MSGSSSGVATLSWSKARVTGMRAATALRLLLAAALSCAVPAHAARPMVTDDARIVDPQACQLETWVRANQDARGTYWAVPACNPTGNLELTYGAALERDAGETRVGASFAQAKTLLRPLRPNDWGLGLTLGRFLERASAPGERNTPSNYLNVPFSLSLRNDDILLHANAGLRRDMAQGRNFGNWGLSAEVRMQERLQLIVETYGEAQSPTLAQGGLRLWLIPDRLQVDATVGADLRGSRDSRWATLGLRVLTPAFLPGGAISGR